MANEIQFILYNLPEGNGTVQAIVRDDTVWLTQKAMGELFGVGVPAISKHLKNIFESGELDENSVVSKMEITAADGKNYNTTFYSLDAIISVGYRVNSRKATFFRQWADHTLPNMGLTTWKYAPDGRVLKSDVSIAKNYLMAAT